MLWDITQNHNVLSLTLTASDF